MLKSLLRNKSHQRVAAGLMAFGVSLALVWLTVNTPEKGSNPLVTAMERDSALFFATERDITALAQDTGTGAAQSIGLSPEYALVSLRSGGRYYVRIDTQPNLIMELLKDKLRIGAPSVFSLADVQPPAPPLTALTRALNPGYASLLGPLLILFLIVKMNPFRGSAMFKTVDKPDAHFRDVIGVEEAKEALQDIVAYLKNPKKFSDLGAKPPRGVVLEGHFGSGKTLLARAVAGEADVPFISLSGSDFTDMFLGVGVGRVKKLFALARNQAPCVIFIDEIDGLGKRSEGGSLGDTENNRIINALLVELDGFSPKTGIVVLGATNNIDNLDPALVRPGRFDRICHLGLPNVDEREALFRVYANKLRTDGNADFRQLARLSTRLSPAAIANVVNAAALRAAKDDAPAVTPHHLARALEQHLMGGPSAPGQSALSVDERQRIAVHEAGHAIVAKVLNVGVVEKVSILKRGNALGVTLVTTEQDLSVQSEAELHGRMIMLLAGRGAETLVLNAASTGAANDLEQVSTMAYRMVTEFGFSKNIGPFSYGGLPGRARETGGCALALGEARDLVKHIEGRCIALLMANRESLDRLTAALLERETVSGEIVDSCLGLVVPTPSMAQ